MPGRTPFSFDAPFAASADLVIAGRRYAAGTRFPWRELGLDERAIWDLWRTFSVHNVAPGGAILAPPARAARESTRAARSPASRR